MGTRGRIATSHGKDREYLICSVFNEKKGLQSPL